VVVKKVKCLGRPAEVCALALSHATPASFLQVSFTLNLFTNNTLNNHFLLQVIIINTIAVMLNALPETYNSCA
jgi:hypothetical protein